MSQEMVQLSQELQKSMNGANESFKREQYHKATVLYNVASNIAGQMSDLARTMIKDGKEDDVTETKAEDQ